MIRITGKHYECDYMQKEFTMNFSSLDDLFNHMKNISRNFKSEYFNYFPHKSRAFSGDSWIGRIECEDFTSNYHGFWIDMIENENGIIYSNGRFTDGQKYCSAKVEEWLLDCENKRKNKNFNFVEC